MSASETETEHSKTELLIAVIARMLDGLGHRHVIPHLKQQILVRSIQSKLLCVSMIDSGAGILPVLNKSRILTACRVAT